MRPECVMTAAGFLYVWPESCPRPAILAKPCGALLSEWGNPFSYSQSSPSGKKEKKKTKEKDRLVLQPLLFHPANPALRQG